MFVLRVSHRVFIHVTAENNCTMRGHCYAVASGKGGVGKTTTIVNTAHELATRGFEVVLVDADLAMTNLGRMLDVEHEPTIHDVLAEDASLSAAIDRSGPVAVLPGSDDIDVLRAADPANLGRVGRPQHVDVVGPGEDGNRPAPVDSRR